jgi:prepilin-type N-terminal cleavage/methylation domain-containing protein
LPVDSVNAPPRFSPVANRGSQVADGFTLVEVMVVVALLSLIVIALMGVFNSTQSAFRASVTQDDVLEDGRAAMDLIGQDLKVMSPSLGVSNGAVNFCVTNYGYPPLYQSLTASSNTRTNVQQNFFILSLGNQNGVPTWFGTGYAVYLSPTNLYSLFRFSTNHPAASSGSPGNLFTNDFQIFLASPNSYSHLIDGVVYLTVRAFDPNGVWMNTTYTNAYNFMTNSASGYGETGFYMFSNTLPASVEIEMATLEDHTLQRAGTWPNNSPAQISYLGLQAGKVHIFRQRISIPNVDPSAYQQ